MAGLEGGPVGGGAALSFLGSEAVPGGGPESVPTAGESILAGVFTRDGGPGGVDLDGAGIDRGGGAAKPDVGGGPDEWAKFVVEEMGGAEEESRVGGPFGGGGVLAELV